MRRAAILALVALAPVALGACASSPRNLPPGYALSESGTPYRTASYHTTTDQPSYSVTASAPAVRRTAPASPAPAPKAMVASPARHTHSNVVTGRFVRLRGSPEIHVASCPKVRRADPDGVLPAKASDGPPCFICRRSEAIGARSTYARAPSRRTTRRARPRVTIPTARRAAAPTYTGRFVRLRGSPEIHVSGCPKVRRADPDAVLPAKASDGPPCFTCRRADAIAWSR